LTARADRYGVQWQEYLDAFQSLWDSPPRPVQWEVAFGNAPDEVGDENRERLPVVVFGVEDDVVRVRGRIDRIDVGAVGGKAVYTVIDYKLSRSPRTFNIDDVESGRALQLVLYAFAARRLGFLEADLFQFGFWSLTGDGFVCGLKQRTKAQKPLDPETAVSLERTLDRVLPRLVESIRNGQFPIVTGDPSETYNADHAAVARMASFRSVAEVLDKRLPVATASIPVGSEA
ncbi:MAG: PD-(D/E)XK nuclease family protein, partial [Planctomycetaceae bacterium]|nr:PD-(D/E)XK nuclease family protein [Planctomycetaceae bacterium]